MHQQIGVTFISKMQQIRFQLSLEIVRPWPDFVLKFTGQFISSYAVLQARSIIAHDIDLRTESYVLS